MQCDLDLWPSSMILALDTIICAKLFLNQIMHNKEIVEARMFTPFHESKWVRVTNGPKCGVGKEQMLIPVQLHTQASAASKLSEFLSSDIGRVPLTRLFTLYNHYKYM